MDEFALDFFIHPDDHAPVEADSVGEDHGREPEHPESTAMPKPGAPEPKKSSSKRRGIRQGILKAANIQDMLLEKFLSEVIPTDSGQAPDADDMADGSPAYAERPAFTVTTMSNNFRRFNSRIGVVFKFQARVVRLLSWHRPSQTLSLLAVFTFVCLDPYLLLVLPPVAVLIGVLVPSFIARHPAAPTSPSTATSSSSAYPSYSPRGPPLAPARTVKPVKELSRDFFANIRDLQNCMEDFTVVHDSILSLVVPKTNFSDEALSSAVFVLLCAAALAMSLAAHLMPWRQLVLAGGWAAIWSGHPSAARLLRRAAPPGCCAGVHGARARADALLGALAERDVILDSAPETREVEIFELQRLSPAGSGEWEPWLFSPSPYDPLSAARIAGARAAGARFFEDVLPPEGWEWSGKKWALDLWSREWVEERIITGVEVETEGERWVYDMYDEHEVTSGVVENPPVNVRPGPPGGVSWEEGEEGMGRRGSWRRRRWVRTVRRKRVGTAG